MDYETAMDFNVGAGAEAPDTFRKIASYDVSRSYETDVGYLYIMPDGRFYYRWAMGCSCWDGEYDSDAFDSFEEVTVMQMSRHYLENMEYEPEFAFLKDFSIALKDHAEMPDTHPKPALPKELQNL